MIKKQDEVELSYYDDEDDMLVSRRRVDRNEGTVSNVPAVNIASLERTISHFVDVILQNQRIVDNVVRSNESLREDISVMIGKMDRLFDKFDEFVTIIKEAAKEDESEEIAKSVIKNSVEPLLKKFEEFNKNVQESNQMLLDVLVSIEKKMKRLASLSSPSTTSPDALREKMMQLLSSKQNAGGMGSMVPPPSTSPPNAPVRNANLKPTM